VTEYVNAKGETKYLTVEEVLKYGLVRWSHQTKFLEVPFVLYWLLDSDLTSPKFCGLSAVARTWFFVVE